MTKDQGNEFATSYGLGEEFLMEYDEEFKNSNNEDTATREALFTLNILMDDI